MNQVTILRRAFIGLLCIVLSALLSTNTLADNVEHNSETIGHYTILFSAFNSQFVPADIAQAHNLVRAKDQALINVSVLDNRTGTTVAADVKGQARNLMQQTKTIAFKVINEPDAVYYLGSIRHTNEEILHFDITVTLDGEPHTVKFTRKLYLEK